MASKEVVTFTGILKFFKDDANAVEKGEIKFRSGYILQLSLSDHTLFSKVRASMKDKCYSVAIIVDGEGGISEASCDCPRGSWLCSHMAATAIYANKKGLSKTDLPNSWISRPKRNATIESKTMADFFPPKRPEYRATSRSVTKEDKAFFYNALKEVSSQTPLQWIIGPEPPALAPKDPLEPNVIEDLLQEFLNDKELFTEKCKVSRSQIEWLAKHTSNQRNSELWGKHRRLRLTGSNFGEVLKAFDRHHCQGRPFPPSLFKKLKGEYSFGTKDAILWGQMHEEHAIKEYSKVTGNSVTPCGLFLFPCGFLGSTPDGIVQSRTFGKGVLEVKCPWKHRNATILEMVEVELKGKESVKGFFLTKEGSLNPEHNYWHQVQAEMVAADLTWCHFVVWTTKEMKVVEVQRCNSWMQKCLPKLKAFYLNELMPQCYTAEQK